MDMKFSTIRSSYRVESDAQLIILQFFRTAIQKFGLPKK